MVDPIAIWDRDRDVLIWDTSLVGDSFNPAEDIPDSVMNNMSPRTNKMSLFIDVMLKRFGADMMIDHVFDVGDSADPRMQLINYRGGYFLKVRLPTINAASILKEIIIVANSQSLWLRYSSPHTWFMPGGEVYPGYNKEKWNILWMNGWSLFLPENSAELRALLAPQVEKTMTDLKFLRGRYPYTQYVNNQEIAKRVGFIREAEHGKQFVFFNYSVSDYKVKVYVRCTFFSDQYISLMGDSGFDGKRDIFELTENDLMGEMTREDGFSISSMLSLVDFFSFLGGVFVATLSSLNRIEDLHSVFFGELSKVIKPFYVYPGAVYLAKVTGNPNYENIVQDARVNEGKWRGPEYFDRETSFPRMLEILNKM